METSEELRAREATLRAMVDTAQRYADSLRAKLAEALSSIADATREAEELEARAAALEEQDMETQVSELVKEFERLCVGCWSRADKAKEVGSESLFAERKGEGNAYSRCAAMLAVALEADAGKE